MKRLFHFLGGVRFAVLLIASALVFVIWGTFLESWSDSHLFAAKYTYKSPLFSLLLGLFFINILFAALRRWPFQKRHVPFLLTHLGLLMVIGGTFVKTVWGLQGTTLLSEGTATDRVYIPNTLALLLETQDSQALFPLKKGQMGEVAQDFHGVSLNIVSWQPHSEEHLLRWVKQDNVCIEGLPPIPLFDLTSELHPIPPSLEVDIQGETWPLYAVRCDNPITDLPLKKPCLIVQQDSSKVETLLAISRDGRLFEHREDPTAPSHLYVLNKGYGGYQAFFKLPSHFSKSTQPIEFVTPLSKECLIKKPHRKQEELSPRVTLLASDGEKEQTIHLTLDRYGSKLKWPILGGKALVRLQSMQKPLPYTVRLREGRMLNYPQSGQPFSFESDWLISDATGKEKEVSISMNKVHETQDGTRFYMSNLHTPPSRGAKKVQLVVNKDPGKFFLTYPGGALVICGMIGLFCMGRKP